MTDQPPVLCLIVAVAENGVIGCDGKMPWHLPSELKYFRARTLGKPVIMGRKTFQAIGKPLPGRANIVITRDASFAPSGVVVVHTLDAARAAALEAAVTAGVSEIMVIGGAEVYAAALPLARRVYLTRIAAYPEGDATFPPLDPAKWRQVSAAPLPQPAGESPSAIVCIYERQ